MPPSGPGPEWVDVVFGTHNTHRVLDLLDQARRLGAGHGDLSSRPQSV